MHKIFNKTQHFHHARINSLSLDRGEYLSIFVRAKSLCTAMAVSRKICGEEIATFSIFQRCQRKKIDCEAAIAHYYDRLGSLQASGFSTNHQVLRDILKEVCL